MEFNLSNIRDAAQVFLTAITGKKVVAFHGGMGAGKTTFITNHNVSRWRMRAHLPKQHIPRRGEERFLFLYCLMLHLIQRYC